MKSIDVKLENPEITTYDRAELTVDTSFTLNHSEVQGGSDRKIKAALRKVSSARVLKRLVVLGPEND